MEEKELFAKRRSSVRMFARGRFEQLPFAFEPLNEEAFRFYDLRSFHFEDSPEAFLGYLEGRGDIALAQQLRGFLESFDLYLYWLRFSKSRRSYYKSKKTYRPTLQETRKRSKVPQESK